MPRFEPPDPVYPVARLVDIDSGAIVMVNLLTMAPKDEAAFLAAWAADSPSIKRHPSCEFQQRLTARPASVVARPPRFAKVAVPDRCTA